ncbi:hypothetical protein RB1201 [Rhodopirellula baltica SH 1]|uniref:Uncharacterized protein n=1 Tax=Rhodopirellula baltica (strain DSM 10527 / NCIMB 13988 / SH1) TaxID=243090 RepID=Q7UXP6_RHOBA|nr:hypothetical protein RB1201 [Rhodopirellula baltica SH 1]
MKLQTIWRAQSVFRQGALKNLSFFQSSKNSVSGLNSHVWVQ